MLASLGLFRSALAFSVSDLFAPFVSVADASSSSGESLSTVDADALKAATNVDPNPAKGGTDLAIADGSALLAASGPNGSAADVATASSSTQISIYVVRPGDTLAGIATMFGVSKNTVLWANDLKTAADIHPGETLVILPVSGIEHVVQKGETLASIVKKYHGTMQDVLDYNDLASGVQLAVGDTVIIPDGVDNVPPVASASAKASSSSHTSSITGGSATPSGSAPGCISHYERYIPGYSGPALPGYFIRPIAGGIKTQCLHGYNAVDLSTPAGTPVMAAASGTVIVAKSSGYNGGYGEYIVINHPNGTQTVYAHLSKVLVSPGDAVSQGDVIAHSGNTGESTGPHLHFEVRGAANPF